MCRAHPCRGNVSTCVRKGGAGHSQRDPTKISLTRLGAHFGRHFSQRPNALKSQIAKTASVARTLAAATCPHAFAKAARVIRNVTQRKFHLHVSGRTLDATFRKGLTPASPQLLKQRMSRAPLPRHRPYTTLFRSRGSFST